MRLALRSLRRKPFFAITAVLTIALAIGANTALFNVIYAVLIQPLPFRDPGTLVQIWETHPTLPQLQVAVPDFDDWRSQAKTLDQIAAHTLSSMNTITLIGEGEPTLVHATMATNTLFPAMGIRPLAGRSFTEEEERAKRHVAVLGENLWRRKFNSDPRTVGRQIRLGTESFTVIGIAPKQQTFPEWADLWIPLSLIEPELQNRRKYHPLEAIAHLKPGTTAEQAQTEIQTIAHRLAQSFPDTNGTVGAYVVPLASAMTGGVQPSLLLGWGAVTLVFLIACANLAHLFIARTLEKRQEMDIREALGAGPWHLIRQVMAESFLVAAVGGGAGLVLAVAAIPIAQRLGQNEIPQLAAISFEMPVVLFAAGISALCAILFGLPACWQVIRPRRLSNSGRFVARGRSRLSQVLMASEVAMALLVLTGSALLMRTFTMLIDENPGFRPERVLTIPGIPLRDDWEKSAEFLNARLIPALRGVPGVENVAGVNAGPMSLGPTERSRFATRFGIEGRIFEAGSYPVAQTRWITPEYFQVLGIPLKRGRWLNEDDRHESRVLINETLARRFFPDQEAVGKRLVSGVVDSKQTLNEIVGVVGDVSDMGLDQEIEPSFYTLATGPVMTLLVKTTADPGQFAPAIREAIHQVDLEIPVMTIQPLENDISHSLARRRFALWLLTILGGVAAFLTAAGVHGMLSCSVSARIREFGVRAAAGASPGKLVAMILREAAIFTAPGLIAGVTLSLGFAKIMEGFVYGLSPTDPLSIAGAAVSIILLTLFSAWLPARRAATVDPATALRIE